MYQERLARAACIVVIPIRTVNRGYTVLYTAIIRAHRGPYQSRRRVVQWDHGYADAKTLATRY